MYLHDEIRGIGLNGPCLGRLAEAKRVGVTGWAWGIREGKEGRGSTVEALGGAGHC